MGEIAEAIKSCEICGNPTFAYSPLDYSPLLCKKCYSIYNNISRGLSFAQMAFLPDLAIEGLRELAARIRDNTPKDDTAYRCVKLEYQKEREYHV